MPYLRPDGKTQVTIEYVDGKPVRLDTVVVSIAARRGHRHRSLLTPDIAEHVIAPELDGPRHRDRGLPAAGQPDRQVRDRRPDGRRRPDRPQDHRRHLRRLRPPRRRRLLRQGPVEGRPLRGLRDALGRQERRGRRARHPLRGAGRLRDRQGRAGRAVRRHVRHRAVVRRRAAGRGHRGVRPAPGRDHPRPRPAAPDLRPDLGLRPLRPRAARTSPGSRPTAPSCCRRPPASACTPTAPSPRGTAGPSRVRRMSTGSPDLAAVGQPVEPARGSRPPAALPPPVARVAVDTGLAHLDRPFDYAVPRRWPRGAAGLPGAGPLRRPARRRLRPRAGRRHRARGHAQPARRRWSAPSRCSPRRSLALARAVADRGAGTLCDVAPARAAAAARPGRGRAAAARPARRCPPPPEPGHLGALRDRAGLPRRRSPQGRSPRAVWSALPGPTWPAEVAAAVRDAPRGRPGRPRRRPRRARRRPGRRGARRPAARRAARRPRAGRALPRVGCGSGAGEVRVVVGTRAAAFAPVADLGLVVVWDDGDDLHAEPRSPYAARARRARRCARTWRGGRAARRPRPHGRGRSCSSTPAGPARSTPTAAVVRAVRPAGRRDLRRRPGPRPAGAGRPPPAARLRGRPRGARGGRPGARAGPASRLRPEPGLRPRPHAGPLPGLRRARCEPARAAPSPPAAGAARSRATGAARSASGTALRAVVVGARRTAEELGRAFPGTPVRTCGRDEVLAARARRARAGRRHPGRRAGGRRAATARCCCWTPGRCSAGPTCGPVRRRCAAGSPRLLSPARPPRAAGSSSSPTAASRRAGADALGPGRCRGQRELADRTELGFPPASRMAAVEGPARAVGARSSRRALRRSPESPRPGAGRRRGSALLLRVPRAAAELAARCRGAGHAQRAQGRAGAGRSSTPAA